VSAAVGVRLAAGAAALLLTAAFAQPLYGANADGTHRQWSAVEFSMKPNDPAAHPWTVKLDASGSGSYTEASESSPEAMPLTVSAATLERLRKGEHAAKSGRCETRQKNIAKTGEKTIRYEFPDHALACTFNYSDDANLMEAATAFEAVAETMQEGERLEHDQRYDRLGLDAEINTLVTDLREGRAIELGNIAPVLHSLVADEHVIDRVRRKAARLLQDPGSVASMDGDPSEP
jgi:hypothetical protein